jgi:hypothetical protein
MCITFRLRSMIEIGSLGDMQKGLYPSVGRWIVPGLPLIFRTVFYDSLLLNILLNSFGLV